MISAKVTYFEGRIYLSVKLSSWWCHLERLQICSSSTSVVADCVLVSAGAGGCVCT